MDLFFVFYFIFYFIFHLHVIKLLIGSRFSILLQVKQLVGKCIFKLEMKITLFGKKAKIQKTSFVEKKKKKRKERKEAVKEALTEQ